MDGPPNLELRSGLTAARKQGDLEARAAELGVPLQVVEVMAGRGLTDLDAQRRRLDPKLAHLRPPTAMAGFEPAIELLRAARSHGRRIGVFGDYDVDGITTATILSTYLEALGFDVMAKVANRDSGYGFSPDDARALHEAGAQVVLTGDTGTADVESLQWLRDRGVQTVVIDHHQVPESIPPTDAFINPHQPDCAFPFKGMCSAGVAFYLCAALRTALGGRGLPDPRAWLDLVALGTVCDMVPMREENQILARHGLRRMQRRERPGLRALLAIAKVHRDAYVDEETLSFKLGPRINAPGRLGPAEPAFTLLRSTSDAEADAQVQRVDALNARRRREQEALVADAHALLAAEGELGDRAAVVVAHKGWPAGIVGVAAAGLAREHRRPAVVLAVDEEKAQARGSVRSFGGVDVGAALRDCADVVVRSGGHASAAGVTVRAADLSAFADAFDRAVRAQGKDAGSQPVTPIDGELLLERADEELCSELERLGPFGVDFEPPTYAVADATIEDVRQLRNETLSLVLRQGQGACEAVGFRMAGTEVQVGDVVGCLAVPRLNRFGAKARVQLQLEQLWRS